MSIRLAVITGGNSGIGLAIARRLLSLNSDELQFRVVLACRNQAKGAVARHQLLSAYPDALVDLVELDTSSVASVERAAAAVLLSYNGGIDLLFCNAGAMAIEALDIGGIVNGLLSHPIAFFESSEALRQQRGLVTADGMGETFQTNVFGHYLLINRLTLAMREGGRVVWTGSAASQLQFTHEDYQHIKGDKAYESSKYIVDQIAIPLDQRLKERGVRCLVAEPGNVCTNFLAGLDVPLFQYLVLGVFYFIRFVLGIARFTINADTAAVGCCFAALAEGADSRVKYHSHATRTGKPFVAQYPLSHNKDTSAFLVGKLDELVEQISSE
ncbi:hypothetical protein IWW39_001927 [Coemansia spiralis]|uniref:Uncharacterized protein n=1 Tax=Coemansia spiralis TaxID=417178 RepID=A0A9W8GP97_9FUNG|nr:hypothetical protein IWW39_001927 [Coemansia spiralis]